MASAARGYNVFDAIRSRVRNQAIGQTQTQTSAQQYGATPGDTGLRTGVPGAVGVGMYSSPFMESPGAVFSRDPTTGQVSAQEITEATTSVSPSEQRVSGAEAAVEVGTGYYGPYDPQSTFGRAANSFVAGIDPTPFGVAGALLSGRLTTDPYGKTASMPSGFMGKIAEMNIQNQYEVAENIRAGTPGYHQFYSGGQLVSITPQTVMGKQVGYAVSGTTDLNSQQAISQYAAAMGYDPSTVNLNSRPGQRGFGIELDAFVPGSGGLTKTGDFVDISGRTQTPSVGALENHIGLTADIYGLEVATQALSNANISTSVKEEMMSALERGALSAQAVVVDGETVGYNTASGSVVTDRNGDPVTSGSGGLVTSGAGVMSTSMYESLKAESAFMAESNAAGASGVGIGDFGTSLSGYTTISGRGGGDGPGGGGYTEVSGRDSGGVSESGAAASAAGETFFAEGGEVSPDQVPAGDAPIAAQAGFVGREPEGLPDGMSVADDVHLEVPEGTFVINAAAVEFAGSDDIKKMILEAMDEAEKQGVDIKQENTTIAKEDLVSLVVSKGEVIIPPQLAEIIGYDRLNKINNRGKAEVERRVQESEQQEAPAPKPPVLAKSGGFISKPA